MSQAAFDDESYRIRAHMYGDEVATGELLPSMDELAIRCMIQAAPPLPVPYWKAAEAHYDETGDIYWAFEAGVYANLAANEETGDPLYLEAAEFALECSVGRR